MGKFQMGSVRIILNEFTNDLFLFKHACMMTGQKKRKASLIKTARGFRYQLKKFAAKMLFKNQRTMCPLTSGYGLFQEISYCRGCSFQP
jgi:hypothetical protein